MVQEPMREQGMAAIAALSDVSVSTVSRALSGSPGVSAWKREQILDIARSIGYLAVQPPHEPRRRPRPGGRVTAVFPEPDRWVFGSILAGLHDVLGPSSASLAVHQGLSASERSRLLDTPSLARRSDVVVLAPMPEGLGVDELQGIGVPVIVAGSVVEGVASVGIDDVEVGRKATNYLVNAGFDRIAYASYADHEGSAGNASMRRRQGFEASMERAGLDPSWSVQVPFGRDAGRVAAERMLEAERLPDALVVCSDEMAAAMLSVFRRAGVRIPEDIAIIGVDDHPIADVMHLSTISQPAREQGQRAGTMALDALRGVAPAEAVTLPTHLIVRDSTARDADR